LPGYGSTGESGSAGSAASRSKAAGAGSAAQIQTGAQILYYGGDAIELITAAVVMTGWYRRGGRDIRRQERRKLRPHAATANGN